MSSPEEDLEQYIRSAQHTVSAAGKPVLLNALLGKSDFRDGSISF